MEEELAKLIYDNRNNTYYNSDNYYSKIFKIISKYYGIKNVSIVSDKNSDSLGYYSNLNRVLAYNHARIIKNGNKYLRKTKTNKSEYFYYLYVLLTILHEMEHVRQHDSLSKNDDTEGIILKARNDLIDKFSNDLIFDISNGKKLIKNYYKIKNFLKKLYIYDPAERLAEHKSLVMTRKISELLKDEDSYLLFMTLNVLRLSESYEKNNFKKGFSPTEYYLKSIDSNIDMSNILSKSTNLIPFDRIVYGYSVDKEYLNNRSLCHELYFRSK